MTITAESTLDTIEYILKPEWAKTAVVPNFPCAVDHARLGAIRSAVESYRMSQAEHVS